jgi:hypothetical protein
MYSENGWLHRFVDVDKDGPAAACGIENGHLLTSVGDRSTKDCTPFEVVRSSARVLACALLSLFFSFCLHIARIIFLNRIHILSLILHTFVRCSSCPPPPPFHGWLSKPAGPTGSRDQGHRAARTVRRARWRRGFDETGASRVVGVVALDWSTHVATQGRDAPSQE